MTTFRDQVTALLQTLAPQYNGMVIPGEEDVMLFIREGEGMSVVFSFWNGNDRAPSCDTKYKAQGKEFTFSRRGHDDSFYIDTAAAIAKELPEQIERVKAAQARLANSREFNLGPAKRFFTPEDLNKIVADLQAGKSYQYQPGHMGTGYTFSTNPRIRNRFDRATASAELVKLVGRPVYVSAFDAD
jgi:hypothetical protein